MLRCFTRRFQTNTATKSLILGVNTTKKSDPRNEKNKNNDSPVGSAVFDNYDKKFEGKLTSLLRSGPALKTGQAKTFYGIDDEHASVTVVGLGPPDADVNTLECFNEKKENTRVAIGSGMKQLKENGVTEVVVDVSSCATAAAEGAYLSTWSYKDSDRKKFPSIIIPSSESESEEWNRGKVYAECQNFARHLMDSPANLMTPSDFAETVEQAFNNCETSGTVTVHIRDREWIEEKKMGAFLSVTQGSDQPPKFVEIHYESKDNTQEQPLVLVGKGVTFDSGGISIKPSKGMEAMRGDMGGAATVTSSLLAAAKLNMKGKVSVLTPLCENLVNGKATKPGDVVTAKNNTTIQVDNTDAEGRLLLADALIYAQEFNPSAVVNAATLTGAMMVALGASASGVYSNDEELWKLLHQASIETGDRLWRMPLFDFYTNQVKPAHLADLSNIGKSGPYGGSCTAAAFLRHFINDGTKWAHLDIASVMACDGTDFSYLSSGMSGRPTRTLAEFIRNYF